MQVFFSDEIFNKSFLELLKNLFLQLEDKEDKAKALEEFKAELSKHSINKKNLQKYIDSYMARVDISGKLAAEFKCDALLVVGSKSSQIGAAEYMHTHMDKVRYLNHLRIFCMYLPNSKVI